MAEVGEGLAHTGKPRDALFITTKVRPGLGRARAICRARWMRVSRSSASTRSTCCSCTGRTGRAALEETLRALCDVKRRGLVRHIGLSNFTIAMLDNAWRLTTEPLAAQHLEYHPYLDATKILDAIRARGMAPIAYCPVALGRVVGDPVIEAIGRAHGKSAVQVALRWIIQQPDLVAIPKTAKLERLSGESGDFRLRAHRRRNGADERAETARFTPCE